MPLNMVAALDKALQENALFQTASRDFQVLQAELGEFNWGRVVTHGVVRTLEGVGAVVAEVNPVESVLPVGTLLAETCGVINDVVVDGVYDYLDHQQQQRFNAIKEQYKQAFFTVVDGCLAQVGNDTQARLELVGMLHIYQARYPEVAADQRYAARLGQAQTGVAAAAIAESQAAAARLARQIGTVYRNLTTGQTALRTAATAIRGQVAALSEANKAMGKQVLQSIGQQSAAAKRAFQQLVDLGVTANADLAYLVVTCEQMRSDIQDMHTYLMHQKTAQEEQARIETVFKAIGSAQALGQMLRSPGLCKAASVAQAGYQIHLAAKAFGAAVAGELTLMKAFSAINSVMAIAAAVHAIVGLFSRRTEPNVHQMILQGLAAIAEDIQTLRREMHARFDRVDQQLSAIVNLLAVQSRTLNRIARGITQLSADVALLHRTIDQNHQHTNALIVALGALQRLDHWRALLTQISHHQAEFNANALRLGCRQLRENWLLSALTDQHFNGAILFNDNQPRHQNLLAERDSVGHSLGYLAQHALQVIQLPRLTTPYDPTQPLPNVDLWFKSVGVWQDAQVRLQANTGENFLTDDIQQLRRVARNATYFVDWVSGYRSEVFPHIMRELRTVIAQLRQQFITTLAQQVAASRDQIALHTGFNWVNHSDATHPFIVTSLHHLLAANNSQIPLPLLLAGPMISATNFVRKPASVDKSGGHPSYPHKKFHPRGRTHASYVRYHIEVDGSASISIPGVQLLAASFSGPKKKVEQPVQYVSYSDIQAHNAVFQQYEKSVADWLNQQKAKPDAAVWNPSPGSLKVEVNFETLQQLSVQIATNILHWKSSGTLPAGFTNNALFNDATITNYCDRVIQTARASFNNTIEVNQLTSRLNFTLRLLQAYGELVGLQPALITIVQTTLTDVFTNLPNNLTLFASLPQTLSRCEQALLANSLQPLAAGFNPQVDQVQSAPLHSTIQDKLLGAQQLLRDYEVKAKLLASYRQSVAKYRSEYKLLLANHRKLMMLAAINAEDSTWFDTIMLQNFTVENEKCLVRMEDIIADLQHVKADLVSQGVALTAEDDINLEQLRQQASYQPQPLLPNASRLRLEEEESDLGFSFTQVAKAVLAADAAIRPQADALPGAVMVVGQAGSGKSTLLNYFLGALYAWRRNPENQRRGFILEAGNEVFVAGGIAAAVTLFPQIQDKFIDTPGLESPGGENENIGMAIANEMVAKKIQSLQSIALLVNSEDIMAGRRSAALRRCLVNMSKILQTKQVGRLLLVINKQHAYDREMQPDDYEKMVFKRLIEWLHEDEMKEPAAGTDNAVIKALLQRLTQQQVILVEANVVAHRQRFLDRVAALGAPVPIAEFNFANYHRSRELFERFVARVQANEMQLKNKLKESIHQLRAVWSQQLQQQANQAEPWITIEDYQPELAALRACDNAAAAIHSASVDLTALLARALQLPENRQLDYVGDTAALVRDIRSTISHLRANQSLYDCARVLVNTLGLTAMAAPVVSKAAAVAVRLPLQSGLHQRFFTPASGSNRPPRKPNNNANAPQGGSSSVDQAKAIADPWYGTETIDQLLQARLAQLESRNTIYLIDAFINGMAANGEVLRGNLQAFLETQAIRLSQGAAVSSHVAIPLNLDDTHWVAVYISFTSDNRLAPVIEYINPNGEAMPEVIEAALRSVFSGEAVINVSRVKYQQDSHNCGPWVVKLLQCLMSGTALPPAEGFDIEAERDAQLQSLPAQVALGL